MSVGTRAALASWRCRLPPLRSTEVTCHLLWPPAADPCDAWFSGPANTFYLDALRALDLGMEPAGAALSQRQHFSPAPARCALSVFSRN